MNEQDVVVLRGKLAMWRDLMREAAELEREIIEQASTMLAVGEKIEIEGARVEHYPGRGAYDYQALAMRLEPDEAIVAKYTKPVTDWRKVVQEVGVDDATKEQFYKPGKPYIRCKVE
ncbi:hypothetical protein D6833_13920 [Candidatus Parcubacteria bacterium]|nr:MAG: hypothetical protein D6833_13920 [Candidatus Parcubacteria bacterium]